MAKTISGVDVREGSIIKIGDNRYGLREEYDPAVAKATKEFYRKGDTLTVKEVKNSSNRTIKTKKP